MFGRVVILAALIAGALYLPAGAAGVGPLLLVDDARLPHVRIAWTRADGSLAQYEADLPYASPQERVTLGENVDVFVGLGGSRLEKGAGHPAGAIVRVGLFKLDLDKPLFADMANGGEITIDLTGVTFNQSAVPNAVTLVQRLQYDADDVEACGLTVEQTEMFNLASADDDMGGTILPQQARFASLDGSEPGEADARLRLDPDGSISLHAVIPYRLLRHKGDPWALEAPGTFFEPFRFDLEFEVLPSDVAAAEGVRAPDLPAR